MLPDCGSSCRDEERRAITTLLPTRKSGCCRLLLCPPHHQRLLKGRHRFQCVVSRRFEPSSLP